MGPAIRAVDLTRSFGVRVALDGLTLDAGHGEVVALLGPNGAGKTTAVQLLNGVLRPDRGHGEVLGLDPAVDGDAVRRRTGVVTEHAGIDDRLSPRQVLATTAAIRGLRGAGTDQRIAHWIDHFGLGERADRPLRGASTGERKRVALARALLHDPEVLFLDEPTSGLDPGAARDVLDLVTTLAVAKGRTVLLCTHVLAEASAVASRVAVLDRGRLRAFGTERALADGLWPGVEADLDLGGPAAPPVLAAIAACRGVVSVDGSGTGARVGLERREVLATVVAALVGRGVAVHAAVPRVRTLDDVYFALQGLPRAADP